MIVVSVLVFLILNSYVAGRLASEITQANFLAEEGLEAARSIRDNSWDDLLEGSHSLDIFGGNWIFKGSQEDVSDQLNEGIRVITIEDLDSDRKKVTSQVTWQFTEARSQEVSLVTYLTNWQMISPPAGYCAGTCTPCEDIFNSKICRAQDGCGWSGKLKICFDDPGCTPCENYTTEPKCTAQSGCQWITS